MGSRQAAERHWPSASPANPSVAYSHRPSRSVSQGSTWRLTTAARMGINDTVRVYVCIMTWHGGEKARTNGRGRREQRTNGAIFAYL